MGSLIHFGSIPTPDGCLRLQSLFFATFVKSKRQKYFPPVLLFFSVVLKACDYIRRLLPGTHAFLSINIAYCMCSTSILADIEVSFGCHSFISVKKMQKENGFFFRIVQLQFRLISNFFCPWGGFTWHCFVPTLFSWFYCHILWQLFISKHLKVFFPSTFL